MSIYAVSSTHTYSQNHSSDVPSYTQSLFHLCESEKASDLHLEPAEKNYRIRLRIDGRLKFLTELPLSFAEGILHHLKILSGANIAENRRPQDGRISQRNIRLSFCPTLLGEKCVLRFLQTGLESPDLTLLGFLPVQLEQVYQTLQKPQGLILVTGPTGSGKSLTLYSMLAYLNQPEKNIMTIEDPIELPIPGISQIQVNTEIGLDFSDLLRSLLRQDPNVLMIGEIRDEKTAKMAIKASQTGHLVLATLHANSALESLPRLENLGIDRLSLISSISLLIAQRLIRKIPKGRCAIFEIIEITPEIKQKYLTHQPLPPPEISLKIHGEKLINLGLTTPEEVHHVCI
jgi:type IV pilus assembly protein PilB